MEKSPILLSQYWINEEFELIQKAPLKIAVLGINQYSSENENSEDILPPPKKKKKLIKKRKIDGKVKNTPKSKNPIEHKCAVCDYTGMFQKTPS